MSGLVTVADVQRVIDVVLGAPQVQHNLRSSPFAPVAAFVDGALAIVSRLPDNVVRLTMVTEAGRAIVVDLDRNDAATASALMVGGAPAEPLETA
jgi:hypothetical protein